MRHPRHAMGVCRWGWLCPRLSLFLGMLTAVTILLALIAAFVVLPPLLVLWALYHSLAHAAENAKDNAPRPFSSDSHHPTPGT